jgi:hypothetical protein
MPRLTPVQMAIDSDAGDAELGDEQGQERHHQREPGKAEEARGGDGVNVSTPAPLG